MQGWKITHCRQHVVHERSRYRLSLRIVLNFLQQRAANTLYSTTNHLAFDQHRVDHHTAIVGDDIFLDLHTPNLDIDIDDCRMHRIRPRDRWRLVIVSFLKPCIDARRPAVVPARARRLRDFSERYLGARHTYNTDAALTQFEVGDCAFQNIGCDCEDLRSQSLARAVNGRRERDCCAARDSTEADGDTRCITKRNYDVVGGNAPGIGYNLSKDRLHALTLRTGARCHEDLAGGVNSNCGTLERSDPGAFDIAADSKAEVAAFFPCRSLALTKCRETTYRAQCFLERGRIVTAVINDRLSVAIRHAHVIWHFVSADHIA